MIEVTGTLPSILSNEYEANNGDIDKIIVKGNDVDIQIYKDGSVTTFVALWLGNGSFEINELQDDANVFPEYIEGDVISVDAIKKVLFQTINSSAIFSYSLLRDVKNKFHKDTSDFKKKFQKRTNEKADKLTKGAEWITDRLTNEEAQDFIRKQPSYDKARVGAVELIDTDGGKTYKVMVGNPSDKTYSVWQLRRNGNKIRTVTADIGLDKDKALEKYYKLKTVDDIPDDEEEKEQVEENQNQQSENNDNSVKGYGELQDDPEYDSNGNSETSNVISDDDNDIIYDAEYTVVDESLKRKKKSKYNGCNVTGCEDGNLSAGEGSVMCNLIEW